MDSNKSRKYHYFTVVHVKLEVLVLASHDRLRVVDDIQAEDEHTREEVQLSHVLARTTVQLTARREPTSVAEHTRKKPRGWRSLSHPDDPAENDERQQRSVQV